MGKCTNEQIMKRIDAEKKVGVEKREYDELRRGEDGVTYSLMFSTGSIITRLVGAFTVPISVFSLHKPKHQDCFSPSC